MPQSSLIDADKWTNIFRVNHARLLTTAMLLSCCGCVEDMLALAEDQVKSFVIPDAFKYTFALRMVVKICLSHVSRCNEMKERERGGGIEQRIRRLRTLPAPERFIYVLRNDLKYQRRDASLLVGMSDEAADRLLRIARRRLARIPIDDPLNSSKGHALS